MDITKAKKLVELVKDNRKILLTLWDGNKISSCVSEEPPAGVSPEVAPKQYCESCQGDEALCNEFLEHLKGQGYQAKEIQLGELGIEESLPKFLEERQKVPKSEAEAEVVPYPLPVVEESLPEGAVSEEEPIEETE